MGVKTGKEPGAQRFGSPPSHRKEENGCLFKFKRPAARMPRGRVCGLTKGARSQPLIPGKQGRLTPSAQDGQGRRPGAEGWSSKLQGEVAQLCLHSSPWFPTRTWELSAFSENTDAAVAGRSGTVCVGDLPPARSVLVAGEE